jgi:hypothetical protein
VPEPAPAPKPGFAPKPAFSPKPVESIVHIRAKSEEPSAPKRVPLAAGMFRRMYGFMR